MKTILLTMFISLLHLTTIIAQNKGEIALDVAGLNPYTNFKDKEIRQALGQPTKFTKQISELGELREYQYGSKEKYDFFRYCEFSEVIEFSLVTPTYSLFKGRIKIGKNVSVFSTLEGGFLEKKSQNLYHFYPLGITSEDYLKIKTNNMGVIKFISFCSPI